ncbi:autotransporter outer membrane beta-barrel domain-containing protein [Pseudomonas sp. PDM26]|uniref:autotransporter outer membrane beta-barrel domain-containing protein n=1 Tax=Pseudomonas sp. PDM26 TaxID=2854766 RepID=UPI001C46DDEC|nr:autotransporter outer membrane beta-barrel domain-containing protein [Pseudomonas sp. PDM26]MBV7550673.1 autotransporter outer membrane beta-barrel domain-containing protein [Pseudomonas sp. PDM26]
MSFDNPISNKPATVTIFKVLTLLPAFFLASPSAMAAIIIGAGQNETIGPADPLSDYVVENGGVLNAVGATTQSLTIQTGSTLNIDGAIVSGNRGSHGILVSESQATLRSATVTADTRALWVSRPNSATQGSTVTVTDSTFHGGETGALATGLSTLTLVNSELRGTNAGSVGLDSRGGDVRALAGTLISGDSAGVRMTNDAGGQGTNTLLLDNSTVEGRSGPAILVERGVQGATIQVQNNSVLRAADGTLLKVQGGSTAAMNVVGSALEGNVQVLQNSSVDLSFNGASMVGDILRENGSTASATMNIGSSFTGRLNNSNLTLNQSSLTMVDNDSIDNLSMNDGLVNFGAPGAQRANRQLEVGTLAGNGIIAMQGNFQTGESDLLKADTATGSYELDVNASGKDATSPQQLTLVQIANNQAAFALLGGRVDVGTFEYDLAERTNATGDTEYYLNPTTRLTPGAQSLAALFQTALTVSYGELKSLENRMSELQADDRRHGLWVRSYGNKWNVDDGSSGVGYRQQQQGFTMGADTRLGDSPWTVGMLAGYSKSDLDLNGGTSAEVNSYYFGPYFGWLNRDTGYYVDGALKFNHFRNESKVRMSDGKRAEGDYSNSAVSAIVEGGRNFDLGDGWFAKPSAQVSAAVIQGKNYHLDNDMEAEGDRTHSLRTKLGVMAGRSIDLGNTQLRPYGRVAVVHEFASNDNNVRVNGNSINTNLAGTGFEAGVGLTASWSENLRFDVGVDYAKGKNIEQPVAVTFGVNYQF